MASRSFGLLRADVMGHAPLAIKWSQLYLSMNFFAALKYLSNTEEHFRQLYTSTEPESFFKYSQPEQVFGVYFSQDLELLAWFLTFFSS